MQWHHKFTQAHQQHATWNVSTHRDGFIEGPKKDAFSISASPGQCCAVCNSRVNLWIPFLLPPMLITAPTLQLQSRKSQQKALKRWHSFLRITATPYCCTRNGFQQKPEVRHSLTQPCPGLSVSHGSWLLHRYMSGHPQSWPVSAQSSLQDSRCCPYDGHSNPQKDLLSTKSNILHAMLLHAAWCPWHLRQQVTKADSMSNFMKISKPGLKNPIQQVHRTSHLHSIQPGPQTNQRLPHPPLRGENSRALRQPYFYIEDKP